MTCEGPAHKIRALAGCARGGQGHTPRQRLAETEQGSLKTADVVAEYDQTTTCAQVMLITKNRAHSVTLLTFVKGGGRIYNCRAPKKGGGVEGWRVRRVLGDSQAMAVRLAMQVCIYRCCRCWSRLHVSHHSPDLGRPPRTLHVYMLSADLWRW